jgi:hypothetical protein
MKKISKAGLIASSRTQLTLLNICQNMVVARMSDEVEVRTVSVMRRTGKKYNKLLKFQAIRPNRFDFSLSYINSIK